MTGSKRATIQTLALLFESDVEFFGLSFCLKQTIDELRTLVDQGIYDEKLKRKITVRIMCCLGDNLEQVSVAGIRKNFSTMAHSCRKCLCSKRDLCNAETYMDIHSDNFWPRTDEHFQKCFEESQLKRVNHIFGVGCQSLFYQFPYFCTSTMLPQCSSHDYLEGCVKKWVLIIIEHFVHEKWITWLALERIIKDFPYKGNDARNKPAILLCKKMRQKASRRIPGTFAEIGNLIRSFTQVMFDHIRNFDDEYWLWLLEIRMFLRYILMPEISQSQLKAMNETLIDLMNTRLRLTKIKNSSDDDTTELSEESESCESCDSSDSDREELVPENENEKNVSKYKPPGTIHILRNHIFWIFRPPSPPT